MDAALARVRDDFDRIARVSTHRWDHSTEHYELLLKQLPARVESAVDVGCGTGALTRRLATRCDRVLGLDLSPNMIEVARSRSAACPNVTFEVGDVMERALPPATFDCIASIATLHHVPLRPVLARLRDMLRPGGTLLVLDLYRPVTPADWLAHAASYPLAFLLRLRHRAKRPPREVREAWAAHGRRDRYSSLAEIRAIAAAELPGSEVRRRMLWRYSLVWRRP